MTPRQDAVEAVTVTTAVGGANVGGSGAVTHQLRDPLGHQPLQRQRLRVLPRIPSLNTNYWFNERNGLPKNDVKLNQYGGRVGGPIVIPGLFDGRGKAFFFVHYEQLRLPEQLHAHPHGAASARARRLVPLQRRRRRCAR